MSTLPQISQEDANTMMRSLESKRNPVEVGFTIYSISEIDPVGQTFNADIKIYCRWHDSELEGDPDIDSLQKNGTLAVGAKVDRLPNGKFPDVVVKPLDEEQAGRLRPLYEFGNAKAVEAADGDDIFYLSPNDPPGWVRWEKRFNVTLHQMFAMENFPFDVQKLQIILRLPHRRDLGRGFKEYESKGVGKQQEFKDWVKLSEWIRYQPVCECKSDTKRRGRFVIEIPIERKPDYYVKNVMCVMAVICFICFFAFAIPSEDLGDRLSVVLTMVLTAVAFKLVIGDALPKISYFTVMDIYLNALFIIMVAVAVENFLVSALFRGNYVSENVDDKLLDLSTFAIFTFGFVVFHLWYICCRVSRAKAAGKAQLEGLVRASEHDQRLKEALRQSQAGGNHVEVNISSNKTEL